MFQFGSGRLFLNPVGGNLLNNPSPTPYAALTVQDVSVDISVDLKELIGFNQYPDDVAPGTKKVSGKFTIGRIDIGMFNQIFFADTQQTGMKAIQADEVHAFAASVPVTNVSGFLTDLGPRYQVNGKALIRGIGAPAVGYYSVTAGTYTFNVAETGNVLISYAYTTTQGLTVQLNQQLMGYGPIFELWLAEAYQMVNNIPNGIHLYACRASKLGQALKNVDYDKPEIDYMAFANAAGQVGEFFQIAA
jgi:hypothetical protein